jgi:DNA-binding beta-propeller fold protein YncE
MALSPDTLTAWVADSGNDRVVVWTRPDTSSTTWSYSTQFGTGGISDTSFSGIRGLTASPDTLTVWVADTQNNRITVWTRPDASSTTWSYSAKFGTQGSGDSNLASPWNIAVSPDTLTAWVTDYGNNRVVVWTRPDASSTTWSYRAKFGTSGSGDSNLRSPQGIAISPDTLTAWVADQLNYRIVLWTRPDASSTTWSYRAQFGTQGSGDSNFSDPWGLAVSADTLTAWVADPDADRVVVWARPDTSSTTWTYRAKFGTEGSGDSNFASPKALAVSSDNLAVWVVDQSNYRISIWTQS